uniref:Holliday junction resolvase RuvC n=1 Tax=viral metagenome TaxID=1070528 RepID=A0A6M3M8R1_9ZZZZ
MTKRKAPGRKKPTRQSRDRSLDGERILTVDSGKEAGVALWTFIPSKANLDSVHAIDGEDARSMLRLIQALRPDRVIVEIPFGGEANFNSFRTMSVRYGAWLTLANLLAIPSEGVWPATWQSKIPGKEHRQERESLGELYKRYAESIAGRELTADEAAAVGVGVWYLQERGYVALPGRQKANS